jgi:hypothetical protein
MVSFQEFFFQTLKKHKNELLFFREILISLIGDFLFKMVLQKLIIVTPLLIIL